MGHDLKQIMPHRANHAPLSKGMSKVPKPPFLQLAAKKKPICAGLRRTSTWWAVFNSFTLEKDFRGEGTVGYI